MRLRETIVTGCLLVLLALGGSATPAGAVDMRLSQERFAAIDPVFEALIPVYRKNQAPAVVRRSLNDLQKQCAKLQQRDPLQRALRWDCRSTVSLNRVTLSIGKCRGMEGCAKVLARTGREFARSAKVAKRANAVYRRQLRGRCLASFLTPKSDLHFLNRLRYRVQRLASAFMRRDGLDIFVEQLLWDQLLIEINDDDDPTAREGWRTFQAACRPSKDSVRTGAPAGPGSRPRPELPSR